MKISFTMIFVRSLGMLNRCCQCKRGRRHNLADVNSFKQLLNVRGWNRYLSRIFPWALNYNCGGPEYPHLFNSPAWDALESGDTDPLALAVGERWRRLAGAPCVTPGAYVQSLATRSEAQLGIHLLIFNCTVRVGAPFACGFLAQFKIGSLLPLHI